MSFLVVTKSNFGGVLEHLVSGDKIIALDLETTGLSTHRGARLFAIALASRSGEYYFNFQKYEGLPQEFVLQEDALFYLAKLFEDPSITWFIHNAKFDLSFLKQEGFSIEGTVHCTMVNGRLEDSSHISLSLEDLGEKIGHNKDDAVANWLAANAKKKREYFGNRSKPYYDFREVPFDVISSYACQDARVCFELGMHQRATFEKRDQMFPQLPSSKRLSHLENTLTKVLFQMEQTGVKINKDYCQEGVDYFKQRGDEAIQSFMSQTGKDFKDSNKLFSEVFASDKPNWQYTEKGNPSFVTDILREFGSQAAQSVVQFREALVKHNFFQNFLDYSVDSILHTNFSSTKVTGRLSSSEPNLQNLKRTDDEKEEYPVRAALVPRPGFFFAMLDYSQIEYRLMLDQAGARGLIAEIKKGLDVHEATAKLANVTRQQAKTVNFLTLYGGGVKKLAEALDKTEQQARDIQQAIFKACPEIKTFIRAVISKAETRGWIFNWMGRRYNFPDKNLCYRAPNYLIQGGAADILKLAMIKITDFFTLNPHLQSRLVLTIHDELVFEIHEKEQYIIPKLKQFMEQAYPHIDLPMEVDVEYSLKNLSEKLPMFSKEKELIQLGSGEKETRNQVQGKDPTSFSFSS